jgi:gliding motility-associated protein GldC
MNTKSQVLITVELDENKLPVSIKWTTAAPQSPNGEVSAPHSPGGEESSASCKSFMLNVWDEKEGNTMSLHLWTDKMLTTEMVQFIHQSMLSQAETLQRATNNEPLVKELYDFCHRFATKAGILSKPAV